MKKLLIATDGFLPRWDGISSFLNEVIPRLREQYDITVIAPNLGELVTAYNIKIIRFNIFDARLGDNYYPSKIDIRRLSQEIQMADVVWVQCLGTIGIAAIVLSKLQKKPLMIYNHMLEWEAYAKTQKIDFIKMPINVGCKFFGKYLYSMCNLILVSSLEHADLLSLMGIKSKKKVVHLGVDTKLYKPAASKAVAKNEIGIDPLKFVVGYGGRVSYEKDLKTLYRAFKRLQTRHNDAVLLIAGGGHPDLEKLFSGKKDIMLTGPKNNLLLYYQAMDVYVLPSLTETTSLTTMEAMAAGDAVVATPVGFVKEYINEGVNGFFFPKQNSYALFERLEYLKNNQEARDKIGRNARQTMVDKYDWEKTTESIIKAIEELMVSFKNR